MSKTDKRRRLGRGLGSLISTPVAVEAPAATPSPPPHPETAGTGSEPATGDIRHLRVDRIVPNRRQPRQEFDDASLAELAASIRSAGLMQPVVVRPAAEEGRFELIAGERRWRAMQQLEAETVPAIVHDVDERTAAEWALVENLQREDLNPLDRCAAFRKLASEFSLTQAEIGKAVGLDRSTVANTMRLAELDEFTTSELRAGRLTFGHARALLAVTNDQLRAALARDAVGQGWSVRELERRLARGAEASPAGLRPIGKARPSHLEDLERQLSAHLGTRVGIRPGRRKGTGKVTIEFFSLDEFQGLLDRLGFDPDPK